MDSIQQAEKIYEVCVLNAKAGKTVTYREVLKYLGYDEGIPGHAIRYGLELAWIGCAHNKLPILTSIVVNDATGEPSPSGFSVPNWEEYAQKVFEYKDWPHVDKIDWDYIWKNRVELSDTYGTRGYWRRLKQY
ncbi:MAG: hypothetical protein KAW47_03130 [Thermoplasmatales archaeon]|nr:hypothetical protein [Thermoplasmatales archaeon]